MTSDALDLPAWAVASPKRRAHIARVVALIDAWAAAMKVTATEARAWHDAARLHDALRDASDADLVSAIPEYATRPAFAHGPAAAIRLEADGEARRDVLDAIRWHTVGNAQWNRTGRALYMADYLEPGRTFAQTDRAFLARAVPDDFDGVFRQVVRVRLDTALSKGNPLPPESVALWNSLA